MFIYILGENNESSISESLPAGTNNSSLLLSILSHFFEEGRVRLGQNWMSL